MGISIKNTETEKAVSDLQKFTGKGITETIHIAIVNELQRRKDVEPLEIRLNRLTDELNKYPKTGEKADKKFYDDLSGGY